MRLTMNETDKKLSSHLAYQQRQQQRRNYLQKKQALRKLFELGKLIERVGLYDEDLTIIRGLLLEAKEKLQGREAENIRQLWRTKGSGLSKEKF